jgi:hypothetical protein
MQLTGHSISLLQTQLTIRQMTEQLACIPNPQFSNQTNDQAVGVHPESTQKVQNPYTLMGCTL